VDRINIQSAERKAHAALRKVSIAKEAFQACAAEIRHIESRASRLNALSQEFEECGIQAIQQKFAQVTANAESLLAAANSQIERLQSDLSTAEAAATQLAISFLATHELAVGSVIDARGRQFVILGVSLGASKAGVKLEVEARRADPTRSGTRVTMGLALVAEIRT
jgi:hypothetical protein